MHNANDIRAACCSRRRSRSTTTCAQSRAHGERATRRRAREAVREQTSSTSTRSPYARLQEKPASMTTMRGRLTNLRPATDGDAEMLVAWHDDPEVSRFWDDERFTLDEMRERLARAEVESWIVEA